MQLLNLRSIVPNKVSLQAKLFLIGMIFNGLGNGVFNVVLQLYLLSLGFNGEAIGSIIMMNSIGAALLTIPAGLLADRYGKKKIVLFGLSIWWLSAILVTIARSVEVFRLAFLLVGVSNATGSVWTPIYSSFFDKGDMDRAFGLLGFLNIISMSIGSLLGFIPPMLVANHGFTLQSAYWTVFTLGVGIFVLSTPFLLWSLRGVVDSKNEEGFTFTLQSKSVVAKFSLLKVIGSLGVGVFFSLFPYYANKKFGIESDALGSLFFISNLVSRLGALKAIVGAISLCVPFYLMIPLAPSFTWLSLIYITRFSVRAMANPLETSLFMKLVQEKEKATANSIRTMAMQGGSVVAPWLGGQIMADVSLDAPTSLGAGLYAIHAISYYFLLRNEKEAQTAN
jgi:DHA1 family multidrug resistance protein-like MFS transporter